MSDLPGVAGAEVAIKREGNRVLIAIRHNESQKVEWADLAPEAALDIAQQMARDAYLALYGHEPPADALKESVIERKRQKLIVRLTIIMRQLKERQKPDEYIVTELIDKVFQEVL